MMYLFLDTSEVKEAQFLSRSSDARLFCSLFCLFVCFLHFFLFLCLFFVFVRFLHFVLSFFFYFLFNYFFLFYFFICYPSDTAKLVEDLTRKPNIEYSYHTLHTGL